MNQRGGHDLAVALALLDGDHALGAAAVACVFRDRGSFAIAIAGGCQHTLLLVFGHQHGNDTLAVFKHHAAHTPGVAAHGTNIILVKTHGLAPVTEQHHIVFAVSQRGTDKKVAVIQVNGNDAAFAGVVEFVQRRLLDRAHGRGHEDIVIRRKAALVARQGKNHRDFLTLLQGEHVDDGSATGTPRARRHFPHLEPVKSAPVGKAQDVVVRVGNKELVNPVVFLGGGSLFAAAAAFLRPVFRQRLAFDVASVRERDHHVGGCNQVFRAEIKGTVFNLAAPRAELGLAKFLLDDGELFGNDDRDPLRARQDVEQVINFGHDFLVFRNDLVLLQTGQALQAHLQNFLSLGFRQAVQAVASHAQGFLKSIGSVIVGVDHRAIGPGAGKHFPHQAAVPWAQHQLGFRYRRGRRIADDGNEVVNVGQGDGQAFQYMAAFASLAQREYGAACHHFAAMRQENRDQVFQVAQFGLAINQRHHVDAEGVLQLGLFVQVVQHHFRHFAALEFDDQAHAGFVALVLNVADAFDFFLMNQFGHALLERLFVDLIGELIDDDGLALAFVDILKMAFGAHHHLAAPRAVAVLDAVDAVNNAPRGKVRRGNDLHQFVD